MHTTSFTLLERLRRPDQPAAWKRFVELYTPLIFSWGRRAGLQGSDAADLVQDVLTLLVQKLPEFAYDPTRSFRSWLRTVTLNKWRENLRRRVNVAAGANSGSVPEPASPDQTTEFEQDEYRRYLVGRALQLMQAEFETNTWKACWESVVEGRPAADVARELRISVNAVYLAKSRVLRRLHDALKGLVD